MGEVRRSMAWRPGRVDPPAVWVAVAVLVAAAVLGTVVLGTVVLGLGHNLGASAGSSPPNPAAAPSPAVSIDPAAPSYPIVTRTVAVIGGDADAVFLPVAASAGLAVRRLPVAVLLGDSRVDPSQYEQLAHDVAGYGLVVVVPAHDGPHVLTAVDTWSRAVDADTASPAAGLVRSGSLVVITHGDAASALHPDRWPPGVAAAAVLLPTGSPPTRSLPVPVVVVAGGPQSDGAAARTAYRAARGGSRALVTVAAADPLAVTQQGRRTPSTDDNASPRRADRIAVIARYAAWWLLARLGDPRGVTFYDAPPPDGVQLALGD